MSASLTRRRWTVSLLFFIPGFGVSSWITRTPAVRDAIAASTAQMGLVLLALSLGSIVGTLASSPLVNRLGTRPVITAGQLINASGVGLVGLLSHTGSITLTGVALGLIGLGMGVQNIAINVEGADVERLAERSVLPSLHGFFSAGMVTGALVGMLMSGWGVPVVAHLPAVASAMILSSMLAVRAVPAGIGQHPVAASSEQHAKVKVAVWKDPRLLLIGALIFALCMSEGTANDWLPLVMVDGHGLNPTWSSGIFAVFAIAMATGRFLGGALVDRLGRAAVLAGSATLAAIGLACVIFADNQLIAGAAVIAWGLGASLGYPVALSAASESGPHAAERVSFIATVGSLASLAGPPLLGTLGEQVGLRQALITVLALVLIAIALSPAARPPTPQIAAELDGALVG